MNPETRITRWHVLPPKAALFDEQAISIEIEDEAGGEFVKICQTTDSVQPGEIRLNPEEWPALREAIDRAVAECRPAPDYKLATEPVHPEAGVSVMVRKDNETE